MLSETIQTTDQGMKSGLKPHVLPVIHSGPNKSRVEAIKEFCLEFTAMCEHAETLYGSVPSTDPSIPNPPDMGKQDMSTFYAYVNSLEPAGQQVNTQDIFWTIATYVYTTEIPRTFKRIFGSPDLLLDIIMAGFKLAIHILMPLASGMLLLFKSISNPGYFAD